MIQLQINTLPPSLMRLSTHWIGSLLTQRTHIRSQKIRPITREPQGYWIFCEREWMNEWKIKIPTNERTNESKGNRTNVLLSFHVFITFPCKTQIRVVPEVISIELPFHIPRVGPVCRFCISLLFFCRGSIFTTWGVVVFSLFPFSFLQMCDAKSQRSHSHVYRREKIIWLKSCK